MTGPALIIDCETTGEPDHTPIQVAWQGYPGAATVVGQCWYDPGVPMPVGAMAVHHILDSDLVDAATWPGAWDHPDLAGVAYVIGHNVDYDAEALKVPENRRRICTLALARRYLPDAPDHKLTTLIYHITPPVFRVHERARLLRAHDARVDVQSTARLLVHLCRVAEIDPLDMDHLWRVSEEARIPKVIAFGKHKGTAIADLPRDYIRWLLNLPDLDPYLRKALEAPC